MVRGCRSPSDERRGGISYMADGGGYRLSELKPLPGRELMALSRQLSKDIALYLPRNTDLDDRALT